MIVGTGRVDGSVSPDRAVNPVDVIVLGAEGVLAIALVGSGACDNEGALCLKFSALRRLSFSSFMASGARRASAC